MFVTVVIILATILIIIQNENPLDISFKSHKYKINTGDELKDRIFYNLGITIDAEDKIRKYLDLPEVTDVLEYCKNIIKNKDSVYNTELIVDSRDYCLETASRVRSF